MFLKINLYILIICTFITTIKQASIEIPDSLKNTPIPKILMNYHPLEMEIEYINENFNNKTIEENINKLKYLIKRIPEIVKNLLLINGWINIDFNETLFENLKIEVTNYTIKKRIIKTNFLAIIQFTDIIINEEDGTILNISSKYANKEGKSSRYLKKQRYLVDYIKINYNYDVSSNEKEEKFVFSVLREILRSIGLRYFYFMYNFIRNKFDNVPLYLVKDSKIYKSHIKYSLLSGYNIIDNSNETSDSFYKEYWNFSQYGFHDIMNDYEPESTITEFTLNMIKEINQITIPKCDLFKFEQGVEKGFHCLRIGQDCINKKEENNYFLEYGFYNNTKIKCYLNDKNNIRNKQCGIKYGNLEYDFFKNYFTPSFKQIKDFILIGKREITELNLYKNQTLKLLKNPPSCKPGTPRTIFFQVPPDIFDEEINNTNITVLLEEIKEINKDVQYEQITLGEKDRKYFVTYETHEEEYLKKSVIKVLNYSGLIRSFSDLHSHNILFKIVTFKTLREIGIYPSLQKIYNYPNFEVLSDKYYVYGFYSLMKYSFPEDYTYMPETYAFPEEENIIKEKFENYTLSEDNLWLVKPKMSSLGIGIHIFHNLTDIKNKSIITKYIHNPHIINKLKYDFRIYVLITGLWPLKLYLYHEGIIRFATEEYSIDLNKIDESFIFLTNVFHNKLNKEKYKIAKDADTDEGSKWSFKVYKNYCKKNGIDFNIIWDQIKDISIKSILSVRDTILSKIKKIGARDKNYFKILGYDFLLDDKFKVHLLEINNRPSVFTNDINDLKLKPQLVADILNIVGIIPFSHDYKDNFKPYDYDKIDEESDIINFQIREAVDSALCEFGRPRGRFELIFPVKEKINHYKKFYQNYMEPDQMLWDILQR